MYIQVIIIDFIYTKHALEKMDSLGIDKKEVESAIKIGMKWKDDTRDIWYANMSGIEVVFSKQKENIIIITAYYSRG